MVSPANADPLSQVQIDEIARSTEVRRSGSETATSRFLDTFGFHLLIVLLGIAMAFM